MNLTSLRNSIATIGDYHKTEETSFRAKDLVTSLTSDDRKLILEIINESNPPIPNLLQFSKKLQSIQGLDNTSNFFPLTKKDANRFFIHAAILAVWRAITDFFGFRISDVSLLEQLDDYSNRTDQLIDARANIPELLFDTSSNLEELIKFAKTTENYNLALIPIAQYQILGMNYRDMSFTLDEIESAYRISLKKYANNPITHVVTQAFQIAYAFELVKMELCPDQRHYLILKDLMTQANQWTEVQKKQTNIPL